MSLFPLTSFLIVESSELPSEKVAALVATLKDQDVEVENIKTKRDSDPSLEETEILRFSYIISNNIEFIEYPFAESRMIPVVTSSWVDKSISEKRLSSLRPFSPDPKYFFKDIFISVADLPHGDKEAIYGGVRSVGGQFMDQLTKFTTHLIAIGMDNEKCAIAQHYNHTEGSEVSIKIVLPHWIDDCLKLKRRLDETPYLLPNPKVLSANDNDDSIMEINAKESQELGLLVSFDAESIVPTQDKVLMGKRFFLGSDLELSRRMNITVSQLIESSGGKIADSIESTDGYIGHYREGSQYVEACTSKLFIGNLNWIYHMLVQNRWSSPLNKLLHYPYPKHGIAGFEEFTISATNYTGDARYYLSKLITLMGGKFTPTLKQSNTHLLVAKPCGKKYNTALNHWTSIKLVSHLWIEECYSRWRLEDDSQKRYTFFPRESNLSQCIAQTRLEVTGGESLEKSDGRADMPGEERHNGRSTPKDVEEIENGRSAQTDREETDMKRINMAHENEQKNIPTFESAQSDRSNETSPIEINDSRINIQNNMEKSPPAEKISNPKTTSEEPEPKRKKTETKPYSLKGVLTGYEKQLSKNETRQLLKLGIQITEKPNKINCIFAPGIMRTEKFLTALSQGPDFLLDPKILFEALESENPLNIQDYFLEVNPDDEKIRELFLNPSSDSVANLLTSAKEKTHSKLFKNVNFNLSGKLPGGTSVIGRILESFGANYKPIKLSTSLDNMVVSEISGTNYVFLLCGRGESKLINHFVSQAAETQFKIVEWNWVIRCIFNMDLLLDEKAFIIKESES